MRRECCASTLTRTAWRAQEHPAVTARSAELVDKFRAEKQITVAGRDPPKPCQTFEEGSFPDYILSVVEKEYGLQARELALQNVYVCMNAYISNANACNHAGWCACLKQRAHTVTHAQTGTGAGGGATNEPLGQRDATGSHTRHSWGSARARRAQYLAPECGRSCAAHAHGVRRDAAVPVG